MSATPEAYASSINPPTTTMSKSNTRAPVTMAFRVRGFTRASVPTYASAMSTLILHALGIDEVRDLFAGEEHVSSTLRSWAAEAFPPPPPAERTGLLDRLGPISRRPPRPAVIRHGVPTGQDLDDVVHGRHISAERLDAAWALVDLWLDHTAWSSVRLDLSQTTVDAVDFAGTLAGVPADDGLQRLLNHQLALPLQELPQQASGFVRGAHAQAMAEAWESALPHLDAQVQGIVAPLAEWLAGFATWMAAAPAEQRPSPDLIALARG